MFLVELGGARAPPAPRPIRLCRSALKIFIANYSNYPLIIIEHATALATAHHYDIWNYQNWEG